MKNKEYWKPSKYVWKKGKLTASRDIKEVGTGSRLIADIIAGYYEQYLPKYVHGKLLDLGCGFVPLFHVYKKYVSDIICVDWENTLHKNDYLDFTCDLNRELPFDNNEFDTIILSDVLEHIHNPELLWKEIARILSKNGIIIMNVPFYYWIHEGPYDYYRYTEYKLKQFIEEVMLEVIYIESVGGLLEVLGDIYSKMFASFGGAFGRLLANIVSESTKIMMNTGFGRKIYNKTKNTIPLGYFVIARKNG
jgi:SAM-dependent methyltransferase